jgi:hypothetical protein
MRTTIYLGTIALGLAFGAANAIAGNLGSDSHSMMFTYGLILFAENQHHAI